jgi:hypothetical protein
MPPTTTTTTTTTTSPILPYTSDDAFLTYGLKPLRTCAPNNPQADCSICLEHYTYENPASKIDQCGHIFHMSCLSTWVASSTTCPLCRARLFLPPTLSRFSNSPRRDIYERRTGEWNVPSLSHEGGANGERDMVTIIDGGRTLRLLQRPSVATSQWRMGALGLGTGMGSNWQPTTEAFLDY